MKEKQPKYSKTVTIQGNEHTITNGPSPLRQGEQTVDFLYELDARELWQVTELEIERLQDGTLTFKELEELNDV